ncbi:MAG TPA: DNA-3-methyladenine glycosylase [Pyrinomonadaceae bacterium]|nr:DNA-3-methyladenine glycosylase [Pyrinomonadaceae bacterium]
MIKRTGKRGKKLGLEFYRRADTLTVARELLGKRLVVPSVPGGERVSGIIVETEAYMGPEDKGAHSYNNRRTARTEIMYSAGGVAYVYFIYGMYYQFNVVANLKDVPHALLVRAAEPEEGLELMRERRGGRKETELASGPGKLTVAFGIDRSYNGEDLRGGRIWIEDAGREVPSDEIASGPRIGIDYAEEFVDSPWRFWIKGNPHVSRRR